MDITNHKYINFRCKESLLDKFHYNHVLVKNIQKERDLNNK